MMKVKENKYLQYYNFKWFLTFKNLIKKILFCFMLFKMDLWPIK